MFTTLLFILYPPLKGFSQIKIHVYVRVSDLPSAPPRGSQANCFRYRGISGFAYLNSKNR